VERYSQVMVSKSPCLGLLFLRPLASRHEERSKSFSMTVGCTVRNRTRLVRSLDDDTARSWGAIRPSQRDQAYCYERCKAFSRVRLAPDFNDQFGPGKRRDDYVGRAGGFDRKVALHTSFIPTKSVCA